MTNVSPCPGKGLPQPAPADTASDSAYRVAAYRKHRYAETGIFVRAVEQDGRTGTFDLAQLERGSVIEFVRSLDRDGALRLVLILLGHDPQGL